MNKIELQNTNYLHRSNRTIETLLINEQQTLFLYNHQGQYYKLFDQKEELEKYLNALPYQMVSEFYSEEALDFYLEKRA
jgi:3-phosphoglycerate kinase